MASTICPSAAMGDAGSSTTRGEGISRRVIVSWRARKGRCRVGHVPSRRTLRSGWSVRVQRRALSGTDRPYNAGYVSSIRCIRLSKVCGPSFTVVVVTPSFSTPLARVC